VRILLDECLPAELADELVGHEVRTVQQAGWSSCENGALLSLASGLAVVTLRARTNRIDSLRPLVPEVLRVLKDIRPGSFDRIGA
jgi:hypothetical protein